MNKKAKNKKGKPNPIPSQEEKPCDEFKDLKVTDDAEKTSDIIENVDEKVDVKEERVPEIVSEVIAAPVETKDEETPKKPKRNRGKKKKGKEDDSEDILDEGPKESAVQPLVVEETKADVQDVEKEPLDVPIVTPTARKKKNKKKNVDQKSEEAVLSAIETKSIALESKDQIIESEIPEIKQETTLQPETTEQEAKSSKKKNKKKKRNDSERSEKEEISCTSGFQKLIDSKDEEIKIEEKLEDKVSVIECVKPEEEIPLKTGKTFEEDVFQKDITSSEVLKDDEPVHVAIPENKNKKKNKKDKKHIPKPEETTLISDESPPSVEPIPLSENIIKEDIPKEKIEPLVEENSPKPKAKIAKPVEKKRKGKQDTLATENIPQETVLTEPIKLEEQPSLDKIVTEEKIATEKEIKSDIEPNMIEQNIPVSDNSQIAATSEQSKESGLLEFEPLNVPDKAMGKKRKKGSKVSKTPDVSFEVFDSKIEMVPKQSEVQTVDVSKQLPTTGESSSTVDKNVVMQEQIISESCTKPTPSDTQGELHPNIESLTQAESKGHILLTPEILPEDDKTKIEPFDPEKVEDSLKFETKSGKKRKKPHKKFEEVDKADEPIKIASTSLKEDVPKQEVAKEIGDKVDASNITKMYDIEISSIKAEESEGSMCDTIPDITYPRASSQQLLDDNNNSTVIREIFPMPQRSPLQESDNTTKNDEVKIAEVKKDTSPLREEKTDLKSKMMEVNQDMEELRLSIERSLAELTAIEKTEEAAEKKFESSNVPPLEAESKRVDADVIQEKDKLEKKFQESDPKICAEKSSDDIKSAQKVQYCKDFDDLFFSICFDKQCTKSDKLQEEIKPTQLDTAIAAESTSEDRDKKVTVDEIKNTKPSIDTDKVSVVPMPTDQKSSENTEVVEEQKLSLEENIEIPPPSDLQLTQAEQKSEPVENKDTETKPKPDETHHDTPPTCPARKDNKGKHKKKKGKQDTQTTAQPAQSTQSTTTSQSSTTQETKKEEKSETKSETKSDTKDNKKTGKQQASGTDNVTEKDLFPDSDYEPIENFEDALTSSVDDVNKTFDLIVQESQEQSNPKINIIAPDEEKKPVSPPKNLLGHPDIPVPSNKRDYKKEKDKIPNEITAKVKIKDAVDVERKPSKNTQTINKLKDLKDCKLSENEEFVYKYSFRKVFLQNTCHVCKKDLAGSRVACCYCNLVFYCGIKHKDEDWPLHQALCFAVSTIGHLKDQKHIYADAKNITGQDYRLVRMQMIVSCEKILKRRLVPWEQEALLYPRMCAYVPCREWRQMKLTDCQGCGQISFCTDNPDHYPKSHSRWCKSYSLYHKLVCYQQTKGRLEPKLPTKVMQEHYEMPGKINEVLASMYEEKIDMNDIQYAALTQLATAPLTTAYCYQLYRSKNQATNGYKKSIFTVHVVGAELQFEADALNKWEVFLLHLRPDLQELRVVLINYNLNPSNLPLELLGKIKLCEQCRQDKRRVVLHFQDKRTYAEYKSSDDFIVPDIVCAFNPSIQRSSAYNGKDPWPSTINAILKMKIPFLITGYTITELHKDCIKIKECSETGYTFISEPKNNSFASVRPDRNFISDDEVPLLFKNYCFAIICG